MNICWWELIINILLTFACSATIWLFVQMINVRAKSDVHNTVTTLKKYLCSINNDITWGAEDKKDIYYICMLQKIHWALIYVNQAQSAIKPFNLLFHHRSIIIYQLGEIEKELHNIMQLVECAPPNQEIPARMLELANRHQTRVNNLLERRASYVIYLTEHFCKRKALDAVCIGDTDEEQEQILVYLQKKKTIYGKD